MFGAGRIPRNSLTLPFWRQLLPRLKTIVVVRNPLEVAYSMKERNGTSYSFGLRALGNLQPSVDRRASKHERLVTHYDFFFQEPELEVRRIADFIGLRDAKSTEAAASWRRGSGILISRIEHLIDARVAPEVIEVYRALVAEASPTGKNERRRRRHHSCEI